MVGKSRLNRVRRRGASEMLLSRRDRRADSSSSDKALPDRPGANTSGATSERLSHESLNHEALTLEGPNQERIAVNSIGRRSDCQRRKTPPMKNRKSASQTPAKGETRP